MLQELSCPRLLGPERKRLKKKTQNRRPGVDVRKQIGSSLGVVTSTNSIPRWEAQNGRSGVDLREKKKKGMRVKVLD
jgi:hypothetical protein